MNKKDLLRNKRKQRIRKNIFGTNKIPRLSVFRSNRHIFAQLIDDEKGETIAAVSDLKIDTKKNETKTDISKKVGNKIAEIAKKKKIKQAVFDRSGYKFHGRVKALAEGAQQGGLNF